MAVELEIGPVLQFEQWYEQTRIDDRDNTFSSFTTSKLADEYERNYRQFKSEMDHRCAGFDKLVKQADAQVVTLRDDLPNISSGDIAGLVRRMARNLVQHVPNMEVISRFDEKSVEGILARNTLLTKIIGSDEYSSDMQQNLFASTKSALTVGFDCVIPVLLQKPSGEWVIEYDPIQYRDVFPEPGAKDVRKATEVYVRRYLTRGEVRQLIRDGVAGWDDVALRTLLKTQPVAPPKDRQSQSRADNNQHVVASGYEIVTWYNSSGAPFLTFSPSTKLLLRIEKNNHPNKVHPVHFLVLEQDNEHPLGKSQVELVFGRQEFQDLILNGAMKLWYRNLNPPLIGYGGVNVVPNLSPGKYTSISNPNARVEAFEVNTQTLMQFPTIAQGNLGNMVNLVGSADQQMAVQAGSGMSATPQGVNAQQTMVDITTNNYQKAIEKFFSQYCSYALTIYFSELKGVKAITPNAMTKLMLMNAGVPPESFTDEGELRIDFSALAEEYFVRCVPGSLVELEDEKQMRILNQLFVPLSQALPAMAQVPDPKVLQNAAAALQFILERQIELSGSNRSRDLKALIRDGQTPELSEYQTKLDTMGEEMTTVVAATVEGQESLVLEVATLREQMSLLMETQAVLLNKLGVPMEQSAPTGNSSSPVAGPAQEETNIMGRPAPDSR